MRYENDIFPAGNFYRTHRLWDGKMFNRWDRIKCFFGRHPIDFWVAGITPHCASCRWHYTTDVWYRLRWLHSDLIAWLKK